MRAPLPILALALSACIPTVREETGYACWSLENGDAEAGGLSGWDAEPAEAVGAVAERSWDGGSTTAQEGARFFSFMEAEAGQVRLEHRCSPVPLAKACTLKGWVQTEGGGQLSARAYAQVAFLDDMGAWQGGATTETLAENDPGWQHFELRAEIPDLASELSVILEGTAVAGDQVIVFWDDLVLSCDDGISGAS